MHIELRAALDFLGDAVDRVMLVVGFCFLIVALSFFCRAYQWVSVVSFLLGVLLIIVGTILHYESFTLKVPSIGGWGTILICVAVEFMAAAVIVFLFAVPGSVVILPTSFRRGGDYIMVIGLERPNAWLTPILAWIGLGLLGFGVMLKFFRDFF